MANLRDALRTGSTRTHWNGPADSEHPSPEASPGVVISIPSATEQQERKAQNAEDGRGQEDENVPARRARRRALPQCGVDRVEPPPLPQLGQRFLLGVELEDDVQDLVVEAAVSEHAGPEM